MLLFILLSTVTTVTALTGCHSDRDKDHRQRLNCTATGFSSIPAGIELSTKVLLFPRNLFTSLSWASFQVFEEIYEIDLTDNKVPELTPRVAPTVPTLSVLRLGWNRLTTLPDGSFSACPSLTELYLDNNNIESLRDHTFSGLSKLEILDLSSNRIKVLPQVMLHPLPAIETLYLEFNKIKVMPDGWFSKKEEVPYLYLSANPWACSCSLGYFNIYLLDHELNVYVRDGPIIRSDVESVVCASPPPLKDKSLVTLEESDLCPTDLAEEEEEEDSLPEDEGSPQKITPAPTIIATTIAITTTTPPSTSTATTAATPTTATTPTSTTTPSTSTATSTATTAATPTATPTTATTPTSTPTTPATMVDPSLVTLHTEYHLVITWSWYETFTSFFEWSGHSKDERRNDGSNILNTPMSHPTESSENLSTRAPQKSTTAALVWVTVPSTISVIPATTSQRIPDAPGGRQHAKVSSVGATGFYCFWLLAVFALLCAVTAACVVAILARLVLWYRRVYKPLSLVLARRQRNVEGVRLLAYNSGKEKEAAAGGGGGVVALYRSVLFVHREGGTTEEDGVREGEGEGGKERMLVNVEPTEREELRRGERGVYRNTLHRLVSKEEVITGWKDVMEEQCWVAAGDGERRSAGGGGGGGGGGMSRKRYSVILREEKGEVEGGRDKVEWVVGGWEVKGGGDRGREEEQRSSWGEWLTQFLPSMPWAVTPPPEGEAAQ